MSDKVSIIIPTFNGSKTLPATLESVLQQEYKNYEIIIVDDGSSDSTVELVKNLAPAAKIIKQQNQGTLAARQTGIEAAQGDLIAFLDQDDLWVPETLLTEVDILKQHPEIGLIAANMQAVDEAGNMLGFNVIPNPESYELSWERLLLIQPIATSTTLFRKELVSRIGGLDPSFGFSGALGDLDMFIRMSEVTKNHFYNVCLGYYLWSETRPGRLVSFLDNLQIYARKYSQHPRLLNENNLELRTRFVLACCNYAIHIYRLLLNQYNHKIPAELLLKLNKHNETMRFLFGDLYETHVMLRSLNFDLFHIEQESQRALLFLYLLRRDLQEAFPDVIQGNLDRLLEWASAVVQKYHPDGDFEVLTPFASELIRKEKISLKQRWKLSQLSRVRNANKVRAFLAAFLQIVLPQESRRRRLFYPFVAGARTIIDEGWKSFFKKSYLYVGNRLDSMAARSRDGLVKIRQEILFAQNFRKKLNFPIYDSPQVAVIVKMGRNERNAYGCMANLLIHSRIPYKVFILFDDAEPAIDNYIGRLQNVVKKAISNGINDDVEIYRLLDNDLSDEKYVLFLSDDVRVTENYLDLMISMLEADNQYGVVTGKVVDHSSKKLLHAGGFLRPDNRLLDYGLGDDPNKPEYCYVRSVDAGFSNFYLIRREILDNFLRNSEFARESIGYFRKIQEKGYRIQFQPNSIIYWHGPKTTGLGTDRNQIMANPLLDNLVTGNVQSRKKILVIDDYIPAIRYGSGFPRLYKMLTCLSDLGYQITFFPVGNPVKVQPETSELQQKGIEVFWGNYAIFEEFSKSRANYYDVVLISRPHVFERNYPSVVRAWPEAAILYDAEALFYARDIVKAEISGVKMQESDKARIALNEMRLVEKADVVISVSRQTKDIMMKNSSQRNIEVWEHILEVPGSNVSFSQRQGLLHFGSFFAGPGSPNEDAVLYFAREVFPEIKHALSCPLYVVGTSPTPAVMELAGQDIEVVGYVDQPQTYFNMCRVNIVPTRIFATGTPLKLIEAMSFGIPSVVNGPIARHLDLVDGKEVLVADTSTEFAMKVIQLYSDESLWQCLHWNSINYITENYSYDRMKRRLEDAIKRGLEVSSWKKA